MTGCTLCPRRCGATREDPAHTGFCRAPAAAVVTRAAPHFWEEPCLSGTKGSGAVFFAGCNLGCVYCQNRAISRNGAAGKTLTPSQLRRVFDRLAGLGVHNLNLVTPTHFAPAICEALADPFPLPVVYNCGGYESVETLRRLAGKVDVYLPDMKYADEALAGALSHAPDYPAAAKAAIAEMVRQTGPYVLDENGLLVKGVLIRHLILPGHTRNTLAVIDWVGRTFAKGEVLFSLMRQYTPPAGAVLPKELCRTVTDREAEKCQNALLAAGIEDGFVQERGAAGEGYVPAFDGTGLDF